MPLRSPDKPLFRLTAEGRREQRLCPGRPGSRLWVGWLMALVVVGGGCDRREVVRPTPQMDIESRFWVRVLLVSRATECTIGAPSVIHAGRYGLDASIQDLGPGAGAFEAPVKVTLAGGQLVLGTDPAESRQLLLATEAPHILTLNGRPYRGKLVLTVNEGGRTFSVVNLIPLEPYLAGVIGAEMPSYWEPEALKAQAIAARTYCLYTKNRFGSNRHWDVKNTQASQVYRGTEAESAPIWNAVTSTYGQVLVTGDSGQAEPDLFPAYFSSVCGGYTEDCRSVFGEDFAPLKKVPCPYCKDVARLGLFFWPMVRLDREAVTEKLLARYPVFGALGDIREITVIGKSDHGKFSRITRVRLTGSTGKSHTLEAENLRLSLDPTGRKIQSTMCDIVPWGNGWAFLSGRGWGHGVGMCQCGAEGMARQGKTARDILGHYYPGSNVVSIY